MLNYPNLNPEDFEALCRDIMERKLGVCLRRFGPGRDGGIDLTDDVETHAIIVQVKHYQSDPAALVRNLKKELPKVQKLQPQQYYICCSRQLSAEKIRELYETFRPWMASHRNIVTQTEIEDFLNRTENDDILRKNYKLWFSDPRVLDMLETQDIFMDCQWVLDEIQEDLPVFVETEAYRQALELLGKARLLCITGNPGTGKSITSRMLAAAWVARGYRLRFTSNVTDLAPLKRSVSADPEVKEIILLDDCFGQAYFEMQFNQHMELLTLIHHVKRNPNKILILNSRITILNEAREKQPQLMRCLERGELELYRLDMNRVSEEDRARILYSHLRSLPQAYIDEIAKDRRYWDIIRHENYNPRILEFVCTRSHYRDIPPEKYWEFVQKCLDNPTEIWKDEYENRLLPVDRILLQTLYSLGDGGAGEADVQLCFNHRIQNDPAVDKTNDPFTQSLSRLTGSMIAVCSEYGRKKLSMVNPSLNDFLRARLESHPLELEELRKYICHPDQLYPLLSEEEERDYILDMLESQDLERLHFQSEAEATRWLVWAILAFGIPFPPARDLICQSLQDDPFSTLGVPAYTLYGALQRMVEASRPDTPQGRRFHERLTDFWICYDLDVLYAENDLLSYQLDEELGRIPGQSFCSVFRSQVDFIRAIYPLFRDFCRPALYPQVEYWLDGVLPRCSDTPVNINSALLYIGDEIRSASSRMALPELAEFACETAEQTFYDLFRYARENLPEEFLSIPALRNPPRLKASFTPDMIRQFLDHPAQLVSSLLGIDALFGYDPH